MQITDNKKLMLICLVAAFGKYRKQVITLFNTFIAYIYII